MKMESAHGRLYRWIIDDGASPMVHAGGPKATGLANAGAAGFVGAEITFALRMVLPAIPSASFADFSTPYPSDTSGDVLRFFRWTSPDPQDSSILRIESVSMYSGTSFNTVGPTAAPVSTVEFVIARNSASGFIDQGGGPLIQSTTQFPTTNTATHAFLPAFLGTKENMLLGESFGTVADALTLTAFNNGAGPTTGGVLYVVITARELPYDLTPPA